jgi:hypothetical protein
MSRSLLLARGRAKAGDRMRFPATIISSNKRIARTVNVALIIFGVGFGLIMGTGLFFLVILPLRRERQASRAADSKPTQSLEKKDPTDPKH